MSAKFEVFVDESEEFYFHLRADNGDVILKSEGYNSKDGCHKGIQSVKENARHDDAYEKKIAKNNKFFFNLKAKNAQVVGSSQMYFSEQTREKGINLIKESALKAPVVEL